jgi:(p)ppGpp synthase/HD superfamily hydrolase
MERVSIAGEPAMMAAVLHDVLEETPITAADLLARGCPPEVVSLLDLRGCLDLVREVISR